MKVFSVSIHNVVMFGGALLCVSAMFGWHLGISGARASSTFFIDVENAECSDGGPGSEAEPWCTINQAFLTLQAGDQAYVAPGTYRIDEGPGVDASGDIHPVHAGTAEAKIEIIGESSAGATVGRPELYDESTLVFLEGGRTVIDKDYWSLSGVYHRNGSGFYCQNADGVEWKDSLSFVEPDWSNPDVMPELGGGHTPEFQDCNGFLVDRVESYSIVADRTCVGKLSGGSVLFINQANDFRITNSIFYGGRNSHYIFNANNFEIDNTTFFGGQEHLGGIGKNSHAWSFHDNLILPGPGQEYWIEFKPESNECFDLDPKISSGDAYNNLFFNGPALKVTTSGGVNCGFDYVGQIEDITVRNNVRISQHWSSNSFFASNNERDTDTIDSNYNFFWNVFPRTEWPSQPDVHFWGTYAWNNSFLDVFTFDEWKTQTSYPQILQDPNSWHYFTRDLEGIDPGLETDLTQFDQIGLENFEGAVHVNTAMPEAACPNDFYSNYAYPYRMNLRMIDYRAKANSLLTTLQGDPAFGGGLIGPSWMYGNSNHAPTLVPIGSKTITEEEELTFSVSASDPDPGEDLLLSASNLPENASFVDHGNGTGEFAWTPIGGQAGTYPNVLFSVSDGEATDEEIITITVNEKPANCEPNWECTEWSQCNVGTQTRSCHDTNTCGTDSGRPDEVRACDSIAPAEIMDLTAQ